MVAHIQEQLKRYDFDWEILDVIVGGRSAIDSGSGSGLRVRTPEEAQRFIECYGYDDENPIEKAELFGNFQEAMSFVRRFFLAPDNPAGLNLEIPRKISELAEVGPLLLMVSPQSTGPSQTLTSLWACAIIKIMHTISHIDKDLRSNYFTDIQKQILDRFYRYISTDENGQLFLGKDSRDSDRIDLVAFETKPKKSRDSVILKLLHKPENVAEDIFDRVGIRFVTKNRFDALRVVKFLKDRWVIMPANIKPSRSRNTLVNTEAFKLEIDRLLKQVEEDKITFESLHERLVTFCEATRADVTSKDNPHTSSDYHAVQFTGRQLVKIKNPLYDDLKAIKGAHKELMKGTSVPDELAKLIERLDLRNIQKEIRFFYPFEVQTLDEASSKEALAGLSSHANYKKSQIMAAMRRVMGELMRFCESSPEKN